jgi:hypothetical protein
MREPRPDQPAWPIVGTGLYDSETGSSMKSTRIGRTLTECCSHAQAAAMSRARLRWA